MNDFDVPPCRKAKELIARLMNKGQDIPNMHQGGESVVTIEIMIPGNKAGIVIGKGGETIKQLQVSDNRFSCNILRHRLHIVTN